MLHGNPISGKGALGKGEYVLKHYHWKPSSQKLENNSGKVCQYTQRTFEIAALLVSH